MNDNRMARDVITKVLRHLKFFYDTATENRVDTFPYIKRNSIRTL